jgi:hypothetical protein
MRTHEELAARYQHQPWYVKLWRCRHYLAVPLFTLRSWLNQGPRPLPWYALWGIHVGCAQVRMSYYYTPDEVEEILRDIESDELR